MRAELTLMALAHESNRYLLTRLMAKATRKLHRPKTRLQDTMNDALERFCSKRRAADRAAEAAKCERPGCMTPSNRQMSALPITKLGVST